MSARAKSHGGAVTAARSVKIDKVVTSGTFSLDGGTWDVENNVWLVGDDDEVIVIDAAHDAHPIVEAVGHRRVVAIVCTHGHDDHVSAAPALAALTGAQILLHPDDQPLWDMTWPGRAHGTLADNQELKVGGSSLRVIHTPGHAPGAVCLYSPELEAVFSGDTLFKGGPGATGRSYSDFGTIVESIRGKLLSLPGRTVVHPGHGDDTMIGAEALDVQKWIDRGH